MSSEVTECADSLLKDFRNFSNKRRAKEAEHNKLQEQLNKNANTLKRQFAGAQNEAKLLQDGIDALIGSAPTNEALRKFCSENEAISVVTLNENFVQPVESNHSIHARDCERIQAFIAGLKKNIAAAR